MKHTLDLIKLSDKQNLQTLVEHRTAYTLERCELNVFETFVSSYHVPLKFNNFVITSMLRGKKVMHLNDKNQFDYLPGESVIVPANEAMEIDFPEASETNPTQCIAMAIDAKQIDKTVNYLNEYFPKTEGSGLWSFNFNQQHFYNNAEIASLTNKIVRICAENSKEKDVLVDLTIKELLIRLMQSQNLFDEQRKPDQYNSLAYVLSYIKSNLNKKISVEQLSDKACMSKATFYRLFKRELGISPNDFILTSKINKAKELLTSSGAKISSISYELGFSDVNYFIRLFKKMVGVTPGNYQINAINMEMLA